MVSELNIDLSCQNKTKNKTAGNPLSYMRDNKYLLHVEKW